MPPQEQGTFIHSAPTHYFDFTNHPMSNQFPLNRTQPLNDPLFAKYLAPPPEPFCSACLLLVDIKHGGAQIKGCQFCLEAVAIETGLL